MQEFNDPFQHFMKWYGKADSIDNFDASAVALATVGQSGQPTVRTVLYKGLCLNGFSFYSHYDSRKGKDLAFNNKVAMLFYWQPLNRQIRIEGTAQVMPRELSKRYFASRPLLSQLSSSVSQQSRMISSYRNLQHQFRKEAKKHGRRPVLCPQRWGGYILHPKRFEFFIARPHRLNERLVYTLADSHWQLKYLSP